MDLTQSAVRMGGAKGARYPHLKRSTFVTILLLSTRSLADISTFESALPPCCHGSAPEHFDGDGGQGEQPCESK